MMSIPRLSSRLSTRLAAAILVSVLGTLASQAHESTVQEVVAVADGSPEAARALGLLALDPANRLQVIERAPRGSAPEAEAPAAEGIEENAGEAPSEGESGVFAPGPRPAWLPPNARAQAYRWDGSAEGLGALFAALERHDGGHHHHHGHRHSHSHGRGFDSRHRGRLLWFGEPSLLAEALAADDKLAPMWREVVLCGSEIGGPEQWAELRATGISVVLSHLPGGAGPEEAPADDAPESEEAPETGELPSELAEAGEEETEPPLDREELLATLRAPAADWYRGLPDGGEPSHAGAELAALWLIDESSAEVSQIEGESAVLRLEGLGEEALLPVLGRALEGVRLRPTTVWSAFPGEIGLLQEDVAALAPEILERHGEEEWRSVVLTNEMHRHLGSYTIIGAKMGLRARELLAAGLDDLTVTARTGRRPPMACLCDGLQVASGASLGRGGIQVEEPARGRALRAEAEFLSESKRLRLRLRPEIQSEIDETLAALLEEHGGLSEDYFLAVRALSLQHWLELDRDEIFEEEWLRR